MAIRESALLVLICCVSTCLAEAPFNGALVGVVVIVTLLLCAIIAAGVALLVVWIRWQRSEHDSTSEGLFLQSTPPQQRKRDLEDVDGQEEEEESQFREPAQNPSPLPPVYSMLISARPVQRAPSPANSFTSDGGGIAYNGTSNGAIGAAVEDNHYDDTLSFKSSRRPAPGKPPQEADHVAQEVKEKSGYENTGGSKPTRRAPPPAPLIGGEVESTLTIFAPLQDQPKKEEEGKVPLPQMSSVADVKLRPTPPAKPPKSAEPPAPPAKPKSSEPPPPPSTKPKQSEPPAPPTKPQSTGPHVSPYKAKLTGPPPPPTKPQSSPLPVAPYKPKSNAPPPPPAKPQTGAATPVTKPKPHVQPKPVELVTAAGSDTLTNTTPGVAPKPKLKPRIPAKPSAASGGGGGEFEESPSVPVSVRKFGEHVASLHADGNTGFSQEYNSLPMGEFGQAIFDAIMPLHACRNRHANIIPYNDNRPKLEPIAGNQDCQHDYINASFIDGLSATQRYIAAQGPKKVTIVDFWRLVWQEKVPTIAMVTALREDSGSKCERYWPEYGTTVYGPYRVSLFQQQVLAHYTHSTLRVQLVTSGTGPDAERQTRVVQHMHFTGWLDNESPDQAGPLLSYLRRLNSLHRHTSGPLLVHCSAGVGRTGSLLAIDMALEQARREGVVDIPAIVFSLRRQRMKMVQTQDQYMFIHDAVLEQLVCGDTQIQAKDLNWTLRRPQQPQRQRDGSIKTDLALQFDVLDQVSPKPDSVPCQKAMLFPNKNRSTDFLPPDNKRVELGGNRGYIHASFVHGYRQKEAFIITQAPLEQTCRDFWKMVHERECSAIVMLSSPVEEPQLCAQYWSEEMEDFDRQYGDVSVRTTHRQQMRGYTIHRMTLTDKRSGARREVTQFQLTAWAEGDLWSTPPTLVEAIHHIRTAQRKAPNKPIIVHGRDTVSRCGVLCALMIVMDQCAVEGVVDVFQAVKGLRLAKPGSIPTLAQYQHLFQLTAAYLDSFDTYANFK